MDEELITGARRQKGMMMNRLKRMVWIAVGLVACLTASAPGDAGWALGPRQIGDLWFAKSGDYYFVSPSPCMDPLTEIRQYEMNGVPYVQWESGGHTYSWTAESFENYLAGLNGGSNGGTNDSAPTQDSRGGSTSRIPPATAVLSPEEQHQRWVTSQQQTYVASRELTRARQDSASWLGAYRGGSNHGRSLLFDRKDIDLDDEDKSFATSCLFGYRESLSPEERDLMDSGGTPAAEYSPPGEALRAWRYGLSVSGRYGESLQRMPVTGTETTARTRGVDVSMALARGRTMIVTTGSHEEVTASGIFSPLDHEVTGLSVVALHRLVAQDTGGLDVDLMGSLGLSQVRYENDIPDVTRNTSYLASGGGLAAGGWVTDVGHLRAVYFYAPTHALGSNRRQVTGRREVQVHSAGLSYAAPLYADNRNAVWLALSGLYQYTPHLPEGYDSDAVNLAAELAFRRERWAVSAMADHTAANDLEGRNWQGRLTVHRNF